MEENVFMDKSHPPGTKEIIKTLGTCYSKLDELRNIVNQFGQIREEWKFYGKKNGWVMKSFRDKRNLFFILLSRNYFKVFFTFGYKAAKAALESEISTELKKQLKEARIYSEGQILSVQIDISTGLGDVEKLIGIKINN